jgi:MarR family transcriptional regulator, 2-MHQ and catechol-resistance regulon repressor
MAAIPRNARAEQTREQERAAAELWTELSRVHGAVRGSLETYLAGQTGLLPEDAEVLALLARAPEQRLRMVDVSAALRLSKSGVTRLVDRLAAQGLVIRAACPTDRRVIWAMLTEEGRATAAAAAPAVAAGLAQLLAGHLSPAELEALTDALRRVAPAAGADA